MSAGISFKASTALAFTQSPCKARETQAQTVDQFQMVVVLIPLFGFGTFSGVSGITPAYNISWPQVYLQLYETYTDTAGNSGTQTSIWATVFDPGTGNVDETITQVNTGGHGFPTGGVSPISSIPVVTATNITVAFTLSGGVTGSYSATLSNPVASYSSAAAAAASLITSLPIPTPTTDGAGNSGFITAYYPIAASPYYFTYGASLVFNNSGIGFGAAAYYGIPCGTAGTYGTGLLDITEYGGFGGGGPTTNQGFVCAGKSQWVLNGLPWTFRGVALANFPHVNLYNQVITQTGTAFPVSVGSTPATAVPSSSTPLGPGGSIPPQPIVMTFTATDGLAGGGSYGILGFRNPPS